jgi:hypothetical protein
MSEYLKQLKALDFENGPEEAPPKPLKAPFDGFSGSHPGAFQKIEPTFDGFDGGHTGPFSKNSVFPIQAWIDEITALPSQSTREGERLLKASLTFVESEHAPLALSCGWDEVSLFGGHRTRLVDAEAQRDGDRR